MTGQLRKLPIRLALRVDGDKWNAYVARSDTMEGAIWVGSIAMAFVINNEERKEAFIALMRSAMSDAIEDITGSKPEMLTEDAPEHERTRS
jgi:hypothetical protein